MTSHIAFNRNLILYILGKQNRYGFRGFQFLQLIQIVENNENKIISAFISSRYFNS